MKEERMAMSQKERDRLHIIRQLNGKELKQGKAAALLGLSVRQTRRILKAYRREGDGVLIHKSRGKLSHNHIEEQKRIQSINFIKEKYYDFGPTLASEYLARLSLFGTNFVVSACKIV